MNKNNSHYDIVSNKLEELNSLLFDENETNELFTQLDYANLGLTRLHNVFLQLIANRMTEGNKTELVRQLLNDLMLENKDLFEEAKRIILKESDLNE